MPTTKGPYIQGNQNLLLSVDFNDFKNSFLSIPKTNILTNISGQYGENNGTYFKTHYYSRVLNVPELGTTTVQSCDIYNDYNGGSGNCCIGLYTFGTSLPVSSSTLYTYSIIYRSATNYTHPNFMYRYEYGPSGYITEAGYHSTANRRHLGDGWYHAWGQFTTSSTTTIVSCYFYEYEYATYNTFDIAGVMLIQGNFIIPPAQFIPVGTTRTNTASLLDLTRRNRSLSLANTSFDSSGQISFDGVSSYVDLGISAYNLGITRYATFCGWLMRTSSDGAAYLISDWNGTGMTLRFNNSSSADFYVYPNNHRITAGFTSTQNVWYHITGVMSYNSMLMYINGVQVGGATLQESIGNTASTLKIGARGDGAAISPQKTGNVHVFNKALSSIEILDIFNSQKTKYGY